MREPLRPLSAADFDYTLPPERIAQTPAEPRDSARLYHLPPDGEARHLHFRDLVQVLEPGDLLVANRSRVMPARIEARRSSGARAEILLLRRRGIGEWETLVRPGRRIFPGMTLTVADDLALEILDRTDAGGRVVRILTTQHDPDAALLAQGSMPLPPYIERWLGDPERYQTVYGDTLGSAAAPTAGLHFTPELLEALRQRDVGWASVTLHVGLDTFRPMKSDDIGAHEMHRELVDVPDEVMARISETRERGGRVIAVGTTTVRALESAACNGGGAWSGWTDLFITPGYQYQAIDGMITNFHLPRSTLLMLVSALVGRERLLAAYQDAIERDYRFYSFGDAMLIL